MRQFAKNRRTGLVAGCIAAAFLAHVPVMAQSAPPATKSISAREPLEIKLVRSKVAITGGKEALTSAATAKPGEILQDVATYTNTSPSVLTRLEATLPVPVNTELVMGSARPANALASTDGKNFYPMPLMQRIKQAGGGESEQAVPLSEYRFLRWPVGNLPASGSRVFSARFRVVDDLPAVASGSGNKQ